MNEAELVLTRILNCDRMSLYLNKDINLAGDKSALLSSILQRRMLGEPVQYILGETEFMGIKIKTDRRALIPRPETEILVEQALEKLKRSGLISPKVLDLGTGSGCIAIAIAKNFASADVWASDISAQALQLAEENAGLNSAKIRFIQADLFAADEFNNRKFDLIISNPPYIAESDFGDLAKEIFFEPPAALKAGRDGLDFYRRITPSAGAYLEDGGLLMFEAGFNQALSVKEMLELEGFEEISLTKDYNNIERVVTAKKGLFKNG